MKKLFKTALICTALAVSVSAAQAEGTAAASAAAQGSYTENGVEMVPLRKTAEALGFKVVWNGENQSIDLDNGEVNTKVYIGEDSYYMASSVAIGMSAPTPLGAAPVLKDSVTYVPSDLFRLLRGGELSFHGDNQTQIPNPLTEYKTVSEAEKAVGFKALFPNRLPQGYKNTYIGTIGSETLQMFFEKDGSELVYRMAKGTGDISGDYNVYNETEKITVGGAEITYKANGETSCAIWEKDGFAFSLYSDGSLQEADFTDIISSLS